MWSLCGKFSVISHNPCTNINHPVIGDVKLDLTFLALAQLRRDTEREVARAARVPMLADSASIFDKTGTLAKLRAWARQATPPRATPADFQLLRFLVFHVHNKVARALEGDAPAAGHCQVKPFGRRRRSESGERSAHRRPDPALTSASDGQNWLGVGRFRSVKT